MSMKLPLSIDPLHRGVRTAPNAPASQVVSLEEAKVKRRKQALNHYTFGESEDVELCELEASSYGM